MSTAARSRWVLGITGVVLLVVSIVMMASNAPASKAQTVHPSAGCHIWRACAVPADRPPVMSAGEGAGQWAPGSPATSS